jgi:hypothetical protein
LRWYRDEILQPTFNDSDVVTASFTHPGETWCATVRPHDGEDYGPIANSNCVIISPDNNHLPLALHAAIEPDEPSSGDDLHLSYRYIDLDGDPEGDTLLRWYRDGMFQPAYLGLGEVQNDHTLPGDEWHATVRPHDSIDYGLLAETEPMLVSDPTANTPPRATNLHITPAQPGTAYNLILTYDYRDADGDPEGDTMIHWYKLVGQDLLFQESYIGLTVVPSSATSIGETWYAEVTPHDGQDYGYTESARAVIVLEELGNYPPEAHDVLLAPARPCNTDTLKLSYTYYDEDRDPEGATTIEWTNNGQPEYGFAGQTVIPSDTTALNQTWCATVTPYDDLPQPGEKISRCVTVVLDCGNTPPVALDPHIEPVHPRSDQALELVYTYFDADEDQEGKTQTRWYKDGITQTQFNDETFISYAETEPGQKWTATIKPHDGWEFGVLTQVVTVTINTPPALAVEISPNQPWNNIPLALTSEYYDVDSDPLNYLLVRWYCNHSHKPEYDNVTILPADVTSPGEQWFATAQAHDGSELSPLATSKTVTITEGTAVFPPIFIPLAMYNHEGSTPSYCEENDTQEAACPLDLELTYDFYPDDVDDWYSVFLSPTASLHVLVSDYRTDDESERQGGQLIVYKDCPTCDPPRRYLCHDGRGGSIMELPNAGDPAALTDLSPGLYYIRIYNPEKTGDTPYHLTVERR